MLEEACASVTGARLLGFVRSRCLSGREQGLVLVRSIWRAQVRLLAWQPEPEVPFRRVVPARDLAGTCGWRTAPGRSTPAPPAKPGSPRHHPGILDITPASSDRRMRPWPDAAAVRARPFDVPGCPAGECLT
jgi:hypothetical protein